MLGTYDCGSELSPTSPLRLSGPSSSGSWEVTEVWWEVGRMVEPSVSLEDIVAFSLPGKELL